MHIKSTSYLLKYCKKFLANYNIKVIPFYALSWKYPEAFNDMHGLIHPKVLIQKKVEIVEVYNNFSDEKSKFEYLRQLSFRLTLDFNQLTIKQDHVYFPTDIDLKLPNEFVFIDAGAFDGDTILSIIEEDPSIKLKKYIGVEPDKRNFKKLNDLILHLNLGIEYFLFENGLGARSEKIRFNSSGDMNASVDKEGASEINLIGLSEIYKQCIKEYETVYIKFDIEGLESEVLNASLDLIKTYKPHLAVSIYHKFDDFWNIPLSIMKLNADYSFYVRNHGIDATDFIFYAIPNHI